MQALVNGRIDYIECTIGSTGKLRMSFKKTTKSFVNYPLAGMRLDVRRRLEQLYLPCPTISQPLQHFPFGRVELGQLLCCDSVGVLSIVKTLEQCRLLQSPASSIEREGNKCTELVVVQCYIVANSVIDAGDERPDILLQELCCGALRKGEGEGHFSAAFRLAFVAEADCRETDGIWLRAGYEALKLLD